MFGQQQVHVYQTYLLTVRIHFLLLAFLLFSFFCFDFILNKTKDNEQINIINLKNKIYLKFDLALDIENTCPHLGLVSLTNDKSASYYAAQNKNKFTCILMTWHIYKVKFIHQFKEIYIPVLISSSELSYSSSIKSSSLSISSDLSPLKSKQITQYFEINEFQHIFMYQVLIATTNGFS